jgi:amidase
MLAAVKPTVGRVSRYGVIPITADQDTPGPMAKFVVDAAIMLGVLEGNNPDSHDDATKTCAAPPNHDYTAFLKADGLKGARIGIPRASFYAPITPPGADRPRGGLNPSQLQVMEDAIAALKQRGAIIVDPADIPSVVEKDPKENFLLWSGCSGADNARGKDDNCSIVLKYGMKRDFNAWLASLGPAAPVTSLTELRQWNKAHEKAGAIKYAQAQLDIADEMDVERDRARWQADRAKDIRLAGTNGIDAALEANNLDALLFPGSTGAAIAARPGYPTVIVPFGMVPNAPITAALNAPPANAFPAGFDPKPQPFGVSFTGSACSEPKLLQLAYSFEQATKKRTPPPGLR